MSTTKATTCGALQGAMQGLTLFLAYIKVLALAERQIAVIDAWWHENRPVAPLLFQEELASTWRRS